MLRDDYLVPLPATGVRRLKHGPRLQPGCSPWHR